MALARVVETSVANSPSQDSNHPDHLFQGILLVGSNHFLISNLFIVQQLISFWTRQQQQLRGRQKLYPRVVLILLRLFLVFRDVKSAASIQNSAVEGNWDCPQASIYKTMAFAPKSVLERFQLPVEKPKPKYSDQSQQTQIADEPIRIPSNCL